MAARKSIPADKYYEAYVKAGHSFAAAAAMMGVVPGAVRAGVHKHRVATGAPGKPEYQLPPEGFNAHGISTLYGPDGSVRSQWVKSTLGHSPEEWTKHVKDVFADTQPVKRIPAPRTTSADLLTVYPIGDQHHGMYSWAEETGADYDIKISSHLLVSAAQHLVELAPASKTALIVNVGDFFHVDNLKNATPLSGNTLDVDTRYAAMIRSGVAMLRTFIDCALEKHENVRLINSPGNHDPIGALWLSVALDCLYKENERIVIDPAPGRFHYFRHGKTLIGVTHGDTLKLESLDGIMAADQAQDWGNTEHRYWITGHIHHKKVLELRGCIVESFRTLAAKDAWATAGGYRAGRDMNAIIYHAKHGEVARHRFDVGMLA